MLFVRRVVYAHVQIDFAPLICKIIGVHELVHKINLAGVFVSHLKIPGVPRSQLIGVAKLSGL